MDAKSALTVSVGASYVKVQRKVKAKKVVPVDEVDVKDNVEQQKDKEKVEPNNKRGSLIREFSRQARNNMFYTMMKIRRDSLPCFVTLTYPKVFSLDAKVWKRHLHNFALRLHRAFPDASGIWKLEPQKRGAPHYHLLIWGASLEALQLFVPEAWYEVVDSGEPDHLAWHRGELGNGNSHCVQEVETTKAMYQYVMKYISKSQIEGWQNVGKWWGIFWKENLPFGQEVVFQIDEKSALTIMRYIRRFTGRPSRNGNSRQVVCDASQWMEKIQTVPMGSYGQWLEKLRASGL